MKTQFSPGRRPAAFIKTTFTSGEYMKIDRIEYGVFIPKTNVTEEVKGITYLPTLANVLIII